MSEHEAPLTEKYPPLARVAVFAMMVAGAWLVMAGLVVGAAMLVSWAGGDVVAWLLGVPAIVFLAGAAVGFVSIYIATPGGTRKR